ncbi:HAMP domain-containing sensor histidine kinase [Dyella subtropica]|uniref:HAMP domain-containing sensor histidine kinase n=1 Tax=Dyella subtropica TaxID=2992127 RepID=UPI0022516B87|nr:HAMP domain-containing sensor histidine kinase [Dyella subtropica]
MAALAFSTLVLAFTLCFGIVLLTPAPTPIRMTIREAAIALRGDASDGFQTAVRATPPTGPYVREVETALAQAMRVRPERVRVRWLDGDGAGKASGTGQSVVLVGDRTLLVDSDAGGFRMRYGADALIEPDAEMPAFEASIQQMDGRWRSVTPTDRHLAAWRLRMMLAFAAALGLLAVPVWIAARSLSRPVRKLAEAAARSGLNTKAPFPLDGPPEVEAVGAAMNAMHARLAKQAEERFRDFAAVAHDIRTPLTALRIRAELVPQGERQRMIDDLDRMAAMISEVLDYARIDRQPASLDRIDLTSFAAKMAADRRSLGQDVSVISGSAHASVLADEPMLHRAIDNLVDNALRFAGSAALTIEDAGDQVEIHIDDNGPGIPANALPGIVAPFQRMEPSRSRSTGGVGLGLAIADRIATAHGGRLILTNRVPHGLRATITLMSRSSA